MNDLSRAPDAVAGHCDSNVAGVEPGRVRGDSLRSPTRR